MRFAVTALLAATVAMAETHIVVIGGNDPVSPARLWADVGDKVEFHFLSGLHSVVEANYNDPAHHNGGFASGYFATSAGYTNAEGFSIEITDGSPLWYYDAGNYACLNGGVGVINPPNGGSRTLAGFDQLSRRQSDCINPSQPVGGDVINI
ncbi:putative GPI-anchored cupredoxin [Ceratocystis lukuohia]|uniref:GPI-anchored cupredoxin n=1 Tax=Ceratocystis lukuohia TaxID=2019550 RepID=A0ABR4MHF9_9PEZI